MEYPCNHLKVVPYHPEGNGIVERVNAAVMKHLRAIVLDRRVKDSWQLYLPLVQRIINTSYNRSIGTTPSKIIFGDMLAPYSPYIIEYSSTDNIIVSDYLQKLNEKQQLLINLSQQYLEKQAEYRRSKQSSITNENTYNVGDYVLLCYPTRPPNKLSPLYRGPLIIIDKIRNDIYKLSDITSNKLIEVHIDRLRKFNVSDNVTPSELLQFAAADIDEFVVESIVDHVGTSKRNYEFRVRWAGSENNEDTWLPYREVKDLAALDSYLKEHPELKL